MVRRFFFAGLRQPTAGGWPGRSCCGMRARGPRCDSDTYAANRFISDRDNGPKVPDPSPQPVPRGASGQLRPQAGGGAPPLPKEPNAPRVTQPPTAGARRAGARHLGRAARDSASCQMPRRSVARRASSHGNRLPEVAPVITRHAKGGIDLPATRMGQFQICVGTACGGSKVPSGLAAMDRARVGSKRHAPSAAESAAGAHAAHALGEALAQVYVLPARLAHGDLARA